MTPQETFLARLRRQRQRNHLPLEAVATETRVRLEFLEALEQNDLSRWPRGLYARAWVRAYAGAVGLDPDDIVDEFCRLFPQGDRRVGPTLEEIASLVGHESVSTPEVPPHLERRADARRIYELRTPGWRDTLAGAGRALWSRLPGTRTAPYTRLKDRPRTSS